MFYSHQLLARKAPLGQIWMAATTRAKINRRKLYKIDIIQICEEILNPAVPMALRLSGILMGGVVIVYQRKVKLLYDDVTHLLVEMNKAWKVKAAVDPTLLPKGKTHAKYEAVTLQDDNTGDMEAEDIEQLLHHSSTATTTRFQNATFFPMGLDCVAEAYVNVDPGEDDLIQRYHQADAANITLFDDYFSGMLETDTFDHFERFDIEGDEGLNMTPQEFPQVPTTLVPSPPQEKPPQENEIKEAQQKPEEEQQQTNEFRDLAKEVGHNGQQQRPNKWKSRQRIRPIVMDNELTIIPGHVYQSWLHDSLDIVSRGRGKKKLNQLLSMKINDLMKLPPVTLLSGLANASGEVHYPSQLLELWRKSTQPLNDFGSPSGRMLPRQQPEASLRLPPLERVHTEDLPQFPVEDFQSETGYQQQRSSIEKLRANFDNIEKQAFDDTLNYQFISPGSSGHSGTSIPSSGSGNGSLQMDPNVQLPSGRSKKRQYSSSSRFSLGSLDPVYEEIPWQQNGRDPKLRRLSENGPTPEQELLEETAATQTPIKFSEPPMDEITHSIRLHLKLHFDTLGAPQAESLNQLAFGMNRRKAAQLFQQMCVLASDNYLRVEQTVAYGDITISRGPKM